MTITWKRYRFKGLDEPFEVCLPVPLDGKGADPDVVLRAWLQPPTRPAPPRPAPVATTHRPVKTAIVILVANVLGVGISVSLDNYGMAAINAMVAVLIHRQLLEPSR